ncbi:MAG: hypothetical protein L7S72_09520 [Flavobacteriales bacterium]|nr:hypothetical protein [Flavobacteriales bacterium]
MKHISTFVDALTLNCIKHNMIEFIQEFGYEDAERRLIQLFGDNYLNNKEYLYQWYDFEISGELNHVK